MCKKIVGSHKRKKPCWQTHDDCYSPMSRRRMKEKNSFLKFPGLILRGETRDGITILKIHFALKVSDIGVGNTAKERRRNNEPSARNKYKIWANVGGCRYTTLCIFFRNGDAAFKRKKNKSPYYCLRGLSVLVQVRRYATAANCWCNSELKCLYCTKVFKKFELQLLLLKVKVSMSLILNFWKIVINVWCSVFYSYFETVKF